MRNNWKYTPHYRDYSEGSFHHPDHNSFNVTGAAATSQAELDKLCRKICKLLNKEQNGKKTKR